MDVSSRPIPGLFTPRNIKAAIDFGRQVGRVGKHVYNAYSEYSKQPQGTPSRKRARTQVFVSSKTPMKYGPKMLGKSGGKFGRRSFKKVKRYGKKFNRAKGIMTNIEVGAVLTDPNSIYIGHGSVPGYQLLLTVCQCIIKSLYWQAFRTEIRNMSDVWDQTQLTRIDLQYYVNGSSSALSGSTISPIVTDTYYATAVTLAGNFCTLAAANPTAKWKQISIYPVAGPGTGAFNSTIDLENLRLNLSVKSALKMQNRSITTVGQTEADEVDNVPIYGKAYEARGSGLLLRDLQRGFSGTNNFAGDVRHGTIVYRGATDPTQSLREPPIGSLFKNAKKTRSVKLEPGEIKTSVLTYTARPMFQNFMEMIQRHLEGFTGSLFHQYVTGGKCRVFAYEKILDEGSGTNLSVAYENNVAIGAGIQLQKLSNTMITYIKY